MPAQESAQADFLKFQRQVSTCRNLRTMKDDDGDTVPSPPQIAPRPAPRHLPQFGPGISNTRPIILHLP